MKTVLVLNNLIMPAKKSGNIKPPNNGEKLKAWLAEYSMLRRESIATIGYRVQIITWGFIGLTLILSGIFASKLPDVLKISLLILVVLLSKASLLMWLGEVKRMIKAGNHLRKIEKKVNAFLQDKVLTWEAKLKKEKKGKFKHMYDLSYLSAIFILSSASWAADGLVLYLLFQNNWQSHDLFSAIILTEFVFNIIVLEIIFSIWFVKHWVNIRESK